MAATTAPVELREWEEGPLRRAIGRRMLLFFVLGDILGAGIYALVGVVAGEVGGAVWAAFGVALVLALLTAFAYAELVTKYPQAGGAALYVNRAFRQPFLTFMVVVAVAASGMTSAATLSRAFGGDYLKEFVDVPTTLAALVFIAVVALINFRGISESIKVNIALTLVEVSGLVLIVIIGAAALGSGDGDAGRAFEFTEDTFVPSPSSAAPRSPSTPSWASRTRPTWPRSAGSRTAPTRVPSSAASSSRE